LSTFKRRISNSLANFLRRIAITGQTSEGSVINSLANLQKDACSNSDEGSQSLASLRKMIIHQKNDIYYRMILILWPKPDRQVQFNANDQHESFLRLT
jgi:hypothetical protein